MCETDMKESEGQRKTTGKSTKKSTKDNGMQVSSFGRLRSLIKQYESQSGKKWVRFGNTARLCGACLSHTAHIVLLMLCCFSQVAHAEIGSASFYGLNAKKELLNKNTASGQVFYPSLLTAASYQFYKKYVSVRSLETGKEVIVYVNDLGPNKRLNRLIDLTPAVFQLLGHDLKAGIIKVEVKEVRK